MALASKKRGAAAAKKDPKTPKTPAKKATKKPVTPPETKEAPPVEVDRPDPTPAPKKPTPTTEVTVKTQSMPVTPGKLVLALDDCKDATTPYPFGALPRVTAEQGTLLCDKENLGPEIEITVLSYNDAYTIAPNDNDAPGDLCRYSYDGVVLNDGTGQTVDEYIEELRQMNYKNAGATHRYEVIALLDDAVEDHDEIGSVVQLSLSNQSAKQFDRYKLNTAMKLRQGLLTEEGAKKVTVTAKTKTFSFTFTMMRFAPTEA